MSDLGPPFGFARGSAFSLAALVLVASTAPAAAPKVDALFPPGGQRGQKVAVLAAGTLKPWPVSAWIDDPQVQIAPGKKEGEFEFAIAADTVPGPKLVRLYNAEGTSSLLPFVVGTLAERVEQEPNNELAKGEKVELPMTINGKLGSAADVDVFAVQLKAGQTLVAAVEANSTLGSPMDGVLQVVSSGGQVLMQENDSPRLDPRLVFTAREEGTYLVRLFAYPAVATGAVQLAGGEKFVYRLTLTASGYLDYTLPLAIERRVDESAASPRPARLQPIGWNIPLGLAPIVAAAPGNPNVLIAYHPDLANLAQVAVVDAAVVVVPSQHSNGQPINVSPPVVICGTIDTPGRDDVFVLTAKKGTRLVVSVASQQLGFPLDVVLRVIDKAGKVLSTQDDFAKTRDAELEFNPPADGEYRVVVGDLYRHGSPRHVYRLSITPARGDFALTLAAAEFTVAVGKTVEIPVTVERRHSFADEIEVDVVGLPEGTTCKAVVSAAKGDTAKAIKLVVTAGDKPFTGPIQVAGKSRGEQSIEHAARFALPDAGLSTSSVWLTVTGK